MKVLQVLLADMTGGAESLVATLTKELKHRGHDVRTTYLDQSPQAIGVWSRRTRLRRAARRWLRIQIAVLRWRPDVIHSHSALPNVYTRLVWRPRSTVHIVTLHSAARDMENPTLAKFERLLAHRTDAVVGVSPEQLLEYQALIGRGGSERVVIRNGVRDDIVPAELGYSETKRLIAVCRITPQKDVVTLLRGWEIAWRSGLAATLTVVGGARPQDAKYAEGFAADVARLSLEGLPVRWLGQRDDVPALLAESDMFVHAAIREAHPIALLEAAATGIPVITTVGVAGQIDFTVAATFQATESHALAAVLRQTCFDFENHRSVARAQSRTIAEKFGSEEVTSRYLNLYQGLLGRRRGRN